MAKTVKRVLFIVSQPFFQWRGSPIRVAFDVQALSQLGYEVHLLVPPFGEDKEYKGVYIHRTRTLPGIRNLPIGPSFPKLLFDCLLYVKARTLMRMYSFSALHGIEDAGAICALLSRRHNIKFVFEKHSDPESYRGGFLKNVLMRMYAAVERWMIRRADAIIGTGPKLASYAATVCPEKTTVEIPDIPSSLTESTMEEATRARCRFARDEKDLLITYVGSFAVYQGIDLLFSSIPIVCKKDARARFVIIGGSREQIAIRRADMRENGCEDRVCFAGFISPDALPAVLSGSDILLSPRIAGANTPLKILDYLKAGRPIVATENGANRQILDESMAVFGAPDAEHYAEAIGKLLADESLREKLAAGGSDVIRKKYNFDYFRSEMGKLYDSLALPPSS